MSNRKYLKLADGYHDRSPYNQYQSSGKYSNKQSNVVSDNRSERSSNINGGTGSRNNSPKSRHSNLSPRSHRVKSSYSKTKELSKRGPSASPLDAVHSSSDQMLKVDSISTDESFPWSQHTSSSGKTYYYNCKTEKSQWEKPKEWLEREHRIAREKKKREAKEKNEHSRNNFHPNQANYSREKTSSNRECSSSTKQDSQGSAESKYEGIPARDRPPHHREEDKRSVPHGQTNYESNSLIVKTTSTNTSAVSTAMHRPDQSSTRAESAVSPSNSLQDISPPVTPINVSIQNSSPRIAASPVISTRSPVLLAHQRSPVLLAHQQSPSLQNQSPVQPNPQRHLTTHHGNSSTPPPPPPPLASHTSAAPTPLSGTTTQAHCGDSSIPNSSLKNDVTFSRLAEDASFNGIHVLSQTQLHPLQQATLLQAQFQNSSNVQPMTSGLLTGSPPAPPKPYFQPIKQSTSAPASPLSFSARLCSGSSPFAHLTSAPSPKHSLVYPPPQTINIQDFTAHFNRGLISHTLGWPSEAVEKQAQRLSDDTLGSCFANNRLKAEIIPLNYHQNLTGMRMAVGAKRIEFLREQTRKLETSDSIR